MDDCGIFTNRSFQHRGQSQQWATKMAARHDDQNHLDDRRCHMTTQNVISLDTFCSTTIAFGIHRAQRSYRVTHSTEARLLFSVDTFGNDDAKRKLWYNALLRLCYSMNLKHNVHWRCCLKCWGRQLSVTSQHEDALTNENCLAIQIDGPWISRQPSLASWISTSRSSTSSRIAASVSTFFSCVKNTWAGFTHNRSPEQAQLAVRPENIFRQP